MKQKFIIFFDVIGDCKECKKSIFLTQNDTYFVGQHFIHHFYNVECVVTKIETQNFWIMKIQITNNFGGSSEIMDYSKLNLEDLAVLLKYSGSLTITVK